MKYNKSMDLAYFLCGDYLPVAFIGSGLSSNYCDWTSLVKKIAQYIDEDTTEIEECIHSDYVDADQLMVLVDALLEHIHSPGELQSFMQDCFEPNPKKIPYVFDVITRSPFAFFLTTNYDTNIEDSYRKSHGHELRVILPSHCEDVLDCFRKNQPFVFKIHGCARLGREFVLGSRDYRKTIYSNTRLLYILTAIFATRPIVFMGYGSRDPHINRYLEYEDQILSQGGMRRFIFSKKDTQTIISKHRIHLLQITEVMVGNWDEIPNFLSQLTFIRIRDQYKRCRAEYRKHYVEFTTSAKLENIWGAIFYIYASSDQGYSDDILEFKTVVENNQILYSALESIPPLKLLYHVILGQYYKTTRELKNAKKSFDLSVKMALSNEAILPPIRSLALRYSGIFYMSPTYPTPRECKYRNYTKAKQLYRSAAKVLGQSYPHELLDVQKCEARLIGEQNQFKKAADLVLKIANKADQIGYRKNEAWCRVNYVECSEKSKTKTQIDKLLRELEKALMCFKELDHLRGQMQVHRLFAFLYKKYKLKKDGSKEKIKYHEERAFALSILTADEQVREYLI